ncbi:MAG: hypothetical protein EPO61_07915 [Nitrospirae bacterium]|nr:MAG: hypothetical protein EPO61_07915 [Nitrospirota bacterium]
MTTSHGHIQDTPRPNALAASDLAHAQPPADPVPSEPTSWMCRKPVRAAIYTGMAVLFLLMLTWRYLPGYLDPTFEKHIQNKQVMIGMTKQQVLKAWGSPYTINVSYTKEGIRREEWIFEDWKDSATVKHRYLYFEEDTLVSGWYYQ